MPLSETQAEDIVDRVVAKTGENWDALLKQLYANPHGFAREFEKHLTVADVKRLTGTG